MKQLTLVEWVRKYKIGESNEDCRECDECECGSDIRYSRQKLLRRDSQRIGGRGIAVD